METPKDVVLVSESLKDLLDEDKLNKFDLELIASNDRSNIMKCSLFLETIEVLSCQKLIGFSYDNSNLMKFVIEIKEKRIPFELIKYSGKAPAGEISIFGDGNLSKISFKSMNCFKIENNQLEIDVSI